MKRCVFIVILLCMVVPACFPQKSLRILFTRFGSLRRYDVYEDEVLEYKLKSGGGFKKGTIMSLRDSTVIFDDESSIRLNQIKRIRVESHSYHARLLQRICLYGAIGYPLLNVANKAITHQEVVLDRQAAVVSGSFILVGILIHFIGIHNIHITENKTLRIMDHDYQNLNVK